MDAELAELRRIDDDEHNIEAKRDSLNKKAGRTKMFAAQRYRPTENYDSEPDSPMVSSDYGGRMSGNGKIVQYGSEYGSEREEGEY